MGAVGERCDLLALVSCSGTDCANLALTLSGTVSFFNPQNRVAREWGIRNGAMCAVRLPTILVLTRGMARAFFPPSLLLIMSTRILGRRTVPFQPCLIFDCVPYGVYPKILVLTTDGPFSAQFEWGRGGDVTLFEGDGKSDLHFTAPGFPALTAFACADCRAMATPSAASLKVTEVRRSSQY